MRPVQAGDGPALRTACFPDSSAAEIDQAVAAHLAQARADRGAWLVAEWDGEIVGSGQLVPWSRNAELADLVVAPAFRRRGIGRGLVTALLNAARLRGYPAVEIGVERDNDIALSLYRQMGFADGRAIHLQLGGAELSLVYLARIP